MSSQRRARSSQRKKATRRTSPRRLTKTRATQQKTQKALRSKRRRRSSSKTRGRKRQRTTRVPDVTVYGKSWCGWCQRAQRLAKIVPKKIAVCRYVPLPVLEEGNKPRSAVPDSSVAIVAAHKVAIDQSESVPIVFLGTKHIGGFTEFLQLCQKLRMKIPADLQP